MIKITLEALLAEKRRIQDEQVSVLETPANSEYHYLSEIDDRDIDLRREFIFYKKPFFEYKAIAYYNSALPDGGQKTATYKSSMSCDNVPGFLVEESENYRIIPQKHLSQLPSYLSSVSDNTHNGDDFIIADATPKLRGKIRRGGDPITPEAIYKVEVTEKNPPHGTVYGVEWVQILRKDTGEIIGEAYCYHAMDPVIEYIRDESKAGLDHSLSKALLDAQKQAALAAAEEEARKAKEAELAQKAAAKAQKKAARAKKKSQLPKLSVTDVIGQVIAGIILAAVLLAAEFLLILICNKGVIDKTEPGLYSIDTTNWEDYIAFQSSNHTNQYKEKIKEGEKRNTSGLFSGFEPGEVPMLTVTPRTTQFYIFDISESGKRGKVPFYDITDLYVKVRVTYSYNGVEDSVEEEIFLKTVSRYSSIINVTLPVECITQSSFMGEPTGSYFADLDYWYFEVIDISGTVEVKEVPQS